MPKLSVTIITRNEADNIGAALESVAWADERLVVDAGSTDGTPEIARRHGARVSSREWTGFSDQKNHAAALASHDWILSIDADERVTPALAADIQARLAGEAPAAGYRARRVTWCFGRWIRSTDWYPDRQLRLYDRTRGRWHGAYVHESVRVEGPVGALRGELQHYAYRDLSHHLETMDRYAALAARQLRAEGTRATLPRLALHPPAAFLRNYVLRRGFTDGIPGLLVSALNACYVFLKFAKLWELERQAGAGSGSGSGPRPPGPGPRV